MNEEDIKQLLQKSKTETSPEFTDDVMQRIHLESRQSIQKEIGISFKGLLLLCFFLVILIGILAMQLNSIMSVALGPNVANMVIPVVILVFGCMLYGVNNLIRIMELSLK